MALNLSKKIWRVKEMARKEGVFAALRAVVRRLRQGPGRYVDVFRHYDFALPYVLPAQSGEAKPGTLLWFIPDFNVGSGGHLNIFRTIWHLEKKGYTSTIVIGHPAVHIKVQEAERAIREHFFPLKARVVMGFHVDEAFALGVAAGTATVTTIGTELCRREVVEALYETLMQE